MRLFEFEAKQLFAKHKIPITEGVLCTTPIEVRNAVLNFDGRGILKVQILSGGRAKAGGIKKVESPEEAETVADDLFEETVKGYPVERILVDPLLDIRREYYLGVTINRAKYKIVVIGSPTGGVDIEEFARKNPAKVFKESFEIDERMYSFEAYGIGLQMKFRKEKLNLVSSIIMGLYNVFKAYDCKLAEINPLVETEDGLLVAADARISVDDDALFRHPELAEMGIEKRHEEGEMTPREQQATDWGIPYLDLDGDIGMFPGGAGF
ncbi:MAG: acetate--CoA ligase family protein, partial [candidate division Zixibacteria bacterium]|nr:acetate--CoA ligase family protein [candidate division Zixibacteria bacterium]